MIEKNEKEKCVCGCSHLIGCKCECSLLANKKDQIENFKKSCDNKRKGNDNWIGYTIGPL